MLGVGPLVVAALGWRRQPWAPLLTLGIGIALLIWMAVEIATIGYASRPPLQPIYLTLGAVIVLVGIAWVREPPAVSVTFARAGVPRVRLNPDTSRPAEAFRHSTLEGV